MAILPNYKNKGKGLSVSTVVLIIFLILKIAKLVTWSWWWILSPIWIPFIIVILYAVFVSIFKTKKRRK